MYKYILCFLIVLSFADCNDNTSRNISPIAKNYIDEVISILKNNSINKDKINWKDFTNDIYKKADGSITIENTYPSISYAIEKLNDKHSYFAANIKSTDSSELKPLPVLLDEIVPVNIGYIRLGYCMGSEIQMQSYIDTVFYKIMKQDNKNLKGWIVDLRGNFGGNMWKMLAAIGPILGEGVVGYFFYPNNSFYTWNYKDGKVYDENGIWGSNKPYYLKSQSPYVAVLTDNVTASSGEAVAIAFKGRKKTKSFGKPTFGVSTSNRSYTLSDGSRINLTECLFADRNKIKYGKSVSPDLNCEENKTLQEAINWIQDQE